MNIFRSTWHKLTSFVRNRFEAAVTSWNERSILFSGVQDTRFDVDSSTRIELVRKHRYWVKNSELVARIRNLYIQFSVGPAGLLCTPNSADEEWNKVRTDFLSLWFRQPEASSRLSMAEVLQQWGGSLFDDGEFFAIKLQAIAPGKRSPEPMLQTVQAHRCQSPPKVKKGDTVECIGENGKLQTVVIGEIVDGVELDDAGAPAFYWFVENDQSSNVMQPRAADRVKFKRVAREDVIHKFKARWPGQLRGIPDGYAAMNTLHDYEDTKKLVMQVSKKLASRADVVKNAAGERNVSRDMASRVGVTTVNSAGTSVSATRQSYFEGIYGARTTYLKTGEELEQFSADRPSLSERAWFDLLISDICCGYNVPKILVVPYSLQGTVARADLDVCTNAFRFNFELIAAALREVYEWRTEWEVKFNTAFASALLAAHVVNRTPPKYLESVIRPPRPPNVDIGYSAEAVKTELQLGITTYQDLFAERQQDWRVQFNQAAECTFELKKLAKFYSEKEPGITVSADEIAQKLDPVAPSRTSGGAKEGTMQPAPAQTV